MPSGEDGMREWLADINSRSELERPNLARIYDHLLGGAANLAVDRRVADDAQLAWSQVGHAIRATRSFLGRAVTFLCEQGVDQFLDLGSGIPTIGHVHETAQRHLPHARVAYVDVDPVAVAHAAAFVSDQERVTITRADLCHPETVLAAPGVRDLLDLDRPVAVIGVGVLHLLPDTTDPGAVLAAYRDACRPGSHLVVTHGAPAGISDENADVDRLNALAGIDLTLRAPERLAELLHGWELVEPGIALLDHWRPEVAVSEEQARAASSYGAVARLPEKPPQAGSGTAGAR